ncbi:MAG: patatin-like phospholipase family protein [Ilumatobacteraceae bacterium]
MIGSVVDVFRLRQYFNVITRTRDFADGVRQDAGLLDDLRRAVITLPFERQQRDLHPFPAFSRLRTPGLEGKRLALMSTGGSGAMASIVGAARAIEEAGLAPSVISLCSGSAMFGFPIAAGIPADEVAAFTLALRPEDYIDIGWKRLATLVPTAGRGFGGVINGNRIEAIFEELLGDMTLGELPIPAYAPIWNIEHNRLDYIGPRTHPGLTVARAIHMAIALPLMLEPVELDQQSWCDGGIVDIFPVHPVLEIEKGCDVALAINGFYPPGFAGEDATGWSEHRASILDIASQVRTCQQLELARANLARLEENVKVLMIEPVSYEKVRGVGFYRQFLSSRDWAEFMRAGRTRARKALAFD